MNDCHFGYKMKFFEKKLARTCEKLTLQLGSGVINIESQMGAET
jgi:hypothetical protein